MEGMDESELQQTVEQAKKGDKEAFDRLISHFQNRIHLAARARLGGKLRSLMDSWDAVQEAYLKALATFPNFEYRGEGQLVHWLTCFVENAIRDRSRYHKAQKRANPTLPLARRSFDGRAGWTAQIAGKAPTASQEMRGQELFNAIERFVDELPDEQREVFIMRAIEKISWTQIAQTMEKTEDASRMLYARARARVAKKLAADGLV
jgi:RNA polymerase sigma-70 factor (ECF subfamily)